MIDKGVTLSRPIKSNAKSVRAPRKAGEGLDPIKLEIKKKKQDMKRRKRPRKNIERDLRIAEMSVMGASSKEIAAESGLSRRTVDHILSRDDIEKAVGAIYKRMIEHTLTPAFDAFHGAVMKYEATDDRLEKEHGFKAIQRTLESCGVLNAGAQAPVHTQIINAQVNIMSPVVEGLIDKYLLSAPEDEDVVDV